MGIAVSIWDLFAGLSVAGLILPEAVAYASIAGLEPQHGIVAAVAGLLVYTIVGRSRFAIVSPTSSSAAILAAVAVTDVEIPHGQRLALATGAVILTGIFFLCAGVARLGMLAHFISRPVLRGFAFALSATIVLRQIPGIMGLSLGRGDPLDLVVALVNRIGDVNHASLAIGGGALVIMIALKRWPRVPAAFIALAGGIAASFLFDLNAHSVSLVGHIDIVPDAPGLPSLSRGEWERLAQIALPLVLIVYAESWGAIRNLGLRHGDSLDPNRELFALGLANLASGLMRGIPVGAGFSASSANESAGASSRLAGLAAGGFMILLVALFGSLVARIPEPILAAVVISAVLHSLNPAPLMHLWLLNRDQYVALAAAFGVLAFGIVDGMVLAIALSVMAALRRLASPRIEQLGRLGDGHSFVDVLARPDAMVSAEIIVLRPTEPLFFANAEAVFAAIMVQLESREGIKALILSLEESSDLDSTALESLMECESRLQSQGRKMFLARSKMHIRDLLGRAGSQLASADRCFWSVDEAFAAAKLIVPP